MRIREDDQIMIFELAGKLTEGGEAQAFDQAIQQALAAGKKSFILDLQDVSYMASSGLGSLIAAHLGVKKHEGRLILTNVSPKVMDLLRILRLASVFEFADSIEESSRRLKEPD
jgi:anti-sigma B factor antagonist